jgi:hypothetical protein
MAELGNIESTALALRAWLQSKSLPSTNLSSVDYGHDDRVGWNGPTLMIVEVGWGPVAFADENPQD